MATSNCSVCGTATTAAPDGGPVLCGWCQAKTGLPGGAGPTLRPPSPCGRCGHREIVRVRMRERTSTDGGETNQETARPFALTWARGEEPKSFFSFTNVPSATPDLHSPIGLLEAYVCRGCGYTELYARDAASIPIGPEHGTELIVAPGGGYR